MSTHHSEAHPCNPDTYWEMEVGLVLGTEELWSLFCHDRGASGALQVAEADSRLHMRYFFSALGQQAQTEAHWLNAFRAAYPNAEPPAWLILQRRQCEDWQAAWREHFVPTPVGKGLLVCPPWAARDAARTGGEGRKLLIIDPGQGFGTGGHASTVLALELIERLLGSQPPPASMLDVGIGSGILAIGAALLGVGECWGLDIDPRTLPEVRRNFELNGLAAPPRLVRGKPDCLKAAFSLLAANITAPILRDFASELVDQVSPGGSLVLSGMLAAEAPSVEAEFTRLGCTAVETLEKEGWRACRLLRTKPW